MIAHTLFLDAARGSVRVVLNLRILALHASDDPRHGAEGRERRVCPRDQPAARLDTDRPGDCSRHGASDEPAPRLPTDVDATANSRVPIVIRRCLVPVAVAKPESEHSAAGRPTCRLVRGPVRPVKPAMVGRPKMDSNSLKTSTAWTREQRDLEGISPDDVGPFAPLGTARKDQMWSRP
jgi:hypothetical protein